jgi:hypothetical protein
VSTTSILGGPTRAGLRLVIVRSPAPLQPPLHRFRSSNIATEMWMSGEFEVPRLMGQRPVEREAETGDQPDGEL